MKLHDYRKYLTAEQNNATDAIKGYLLEYAVKDHYNKKLTISKSGKVDLSLPINGKLHRVEVKQNGGDFRFNCKGNTFIVYAVYIDENKALADQFGYVMPMEVFKNAGYALNHIRTEKRDINGNVKMSLQTLYNYKKNDFHGAKAFKLSALWEEMGAIPFREFFR